MTVMAKKKPSGDRHKKKQTQLRLHPLLRAQLEKLVERKLTTMASEITEALRKHLEANNLWPPREDEE